MTAYRNGKGKFVSKDNPLAVIGRLNAALAARKRDNALQDRDARRAEARRLHGVREYGGQRTRAELAERVA